MADGKSVRLQALGVLGLLGAFIGAVAMFPAAAAANPCDTVDTCIPQLRYGETRALREVAAQFLGERGNPKGLPALVAALEKDRGEFVRVKAAEALGRIGTPDTVKPLTRALAGAGRDRRDLVRQTAAKALGNLETKDGRAALLAALARDPAWPVRAASAWSLSKSAPTRVIVEAIGRSLRRDPRREVRLMTAQALAGMKSPRAAAALIEALDKESLPDVKAEVAKAMIEIDSKAVGQALLLALREDADRLVRRQVAESLGRRRIDTAVGGLVQTLREDQAIEVRVEAATSLGRIGGKEARAALTYFDKNSLFPKIRLAAKNALETFPAKDKEPPAPKTTNR
ncbi:MAG: HEAT repeat domain-containing protein [bacterium]